MGKTDSRDLIWDVFRGTAALMVIFHHYTRRYDILFGHIEPWPVQSEFSLGAWGVCVFFILTGFFLIPSLSNSSSISVYYRKRIVRLYSSYIPCVIITWLLMCIAPPLGERNVDFYSFLWNLTMFQSFLGIPNVDGAYWTLAVQLIIYIVSAIFFFWLGKNLKKFLAFLFFWFVLCFGISLLNKGLGFTGLTFISNTKYIHLFIQGVLVYVISMKIVPSFLSYSFLILCVCYNLLWHSMSYFLFNALIIILILLIKSNGWKWEKKGVLTFLGSISFPLYLLHQNIGYLIIRFTEQKGLTNEIGIIVPIAIVISLAWIVTIFIEKPLSRFFNRLLFRQQTLSSTC